MPAEHPTARKKAAGLACKGGGGGGRGRPRHPAAAARERAAAFRVDDDDAGDGAFVITGFVIPRTREYVPVTAADAVLEGVLSPGGAGRPTTTPTTHHFYYNSSSSSSPSPDTPGVDSRRSSRNLLSPPTVSPPLLSPCSFEQYRRYAVVDRQRPPQHDPLLFKSHPMQVPQTRVPIFRDARAMLAPSEPTSSRRPFMSRGFKRANAEIIVGNVYDVFDPEQEEQEEEEEEEEGQEEADDLLFALEM